MIKNACDSVGLHSARFLYRTNKPGNGRTMAGKSRATFNKTAIARAKREKRQEKLQRKLDRRQEARDRKNGEYTGEETAGEIDEAQGQDEEQER